MKQNIGSFDYLNLFYLFHRNADIFCNKALRLMGCVILKW